MKEIYNCDVGCPIQNTLQVISGKWKSVILYHLFEFDVLRFSELQAKLPYVTKRMLARQLAELEEDNIINKKIYATIPVKTEYSISKFGQTLQPVIKSMEIWGIAYNGISTGKWPIFIQFVKLKYRSLFHVSEVSGGGKPIYWGANEYASHDSKGRWQCTVTKSPTEAVLGVIGKGWYSALADSWK